MHKRMHFFSSCIGSLVLLMVISSFPQSSAVAAPVLQTTPIFVRICYLPAGCLNPNNTNTEQVSLNWYVAQVLANE